MKRILCFCFASRLDRRLLNQLGPTGEEEEVGSAEGGNGGGEGHGGGM